MRITNNMNTLNNFNTLSTNLRDVGSINNNTQIQNNSKLESVSKNTNTQIPKVEYSSTEKQQILSSLQRDLNPINIPTNEMMKSIMESSKLLTFSVIENEATPQVKPLESQLIIVKTTNRENEIVDFDSMDEKEILFSDYKPTPIVTSSSKSIAEFLKNNDFDESTYFNDSDFFG